MHRHVFLLIAPERQKVIVLFGETDSELLDTIKHIYNKFDIHLQLFS
jgi:hypothetical protein